MKIPIKIVDGKLFLDGFLFPNSKYRRPPMRISFAVDTGSEETFLTFQHIAQYNLPFNQMEKIGSIYIVNGYYELLKMQTSKIFFRTDVGSAETINLPFIKVAKPTKADEKNLSISQQLPAILGTDFLLENKLILFVDMAKGVAYLESSV